MWLVLATCKSLSPGRANKICDRPLSSRCPPIYRSDDSLKSNIVFRHPASWREAAAKYPRVRYRGQRFTSRPISGPARVHWAFVMEREVNCSNFEGINCSIASFTRMTSSLLAWAAIIPARAVADALQPSLRLVVAVSRLCSECPLPPPRWRTRAAR